MPCRIFNDHLFRSECCSQETSFIKYIQTIIFIYIFILYLYIYIYIYIYYIYIYIYIFLNFQVPTTMIEQLRHQYEVEQCRKSREKPVSNALSFINSVNILLIDIVGCPVIPLWYLLYLAVVSLCILWISYISLFKSLTMTITLRESNNC